MSIESIIEQAWAERASLTAASAPARLREAVETALGELDSGRLRVAEKIDGAWIVHQSLAPHVNAVHEPFNVNRAALAAGLASLRRVELLPARRDQVHSARAALVKPLQAAGPPRGGHSL